MTDEKHPKPDPISDEQRIREAQEIHSAMAAVWREKQMAIARSALFTGAAFPAYAYTHQ